MKTDIHGSAALVLARGVGRPRSEGTRTQILAATVRLLETRTVQSISIEAIAREAGVGKATIYRWWDSKALVVIDAFMEHHVVKTPMPRNLPPGKAIASHLVSLIHEYAGWSGRIVAQIIAEGQSDPVVLREFRERFHYGRRALVREMLDEWRVAERILAPANVETLAELLYAPVYMRLLSGSGPLDDRFAQEHINYIYTLLGIEPPDIAELNVVKRSFPVEKTAATR
ncbi:TetR/AcrR family transcriptional regulator [Paraburkholderia dipogonis]|jgi:AcrR family transcriptional regulator|uniref:TetR/AcrR family transcriptional regulator n=1 Tax=Paraburkholderia dipogonis TaxID=1211383 RepID=A0A4Y8MKZ3_9BURK|nr:TetR/AcrR family transcriptional regulator [Paraburkholderia dipogonis]TFE38101.1 TetR/AcrR family transcriptional regulator [Paraburkholderia dipogonis]